MKKFFQVLGIVTLLLVGLYYIEECSGTKDQSEAVEDVQDDLEMEKSVHLKFKGVPIDGTLKEFISRMERKGFEHRVSTDSKIPISEQMRIVCVPFIWGNVCIKPIFQLPREILHLV